jgi:quinone-modifying oxidoreductase subunit QmoC
MATVFPSAEFRKELKKRGGATAARCYQCATCSGVCELAEEDAPFPRRQMLLAQWGLVDQLAADPTVWLCHQCNDCSTRCPRDAKPGDVMQTIRALMIQSLATPKFLGKLVGNVKATWPLLIGLPFVFWIAFIYAVNGGLDFHLHEGTQMAWHHFVPHWMIYVTYIPTTLWVVIAIFISAKKYWNLMGEGVTRTGSFVGNLSPVIMEILVHKRFGTCETGRPRKTGHFLFVLGFIGAAITTGVIVIAMYGFNYPLPVPLTNPMKWIGNISAVLLIVGGAMLVMNRLKGGEAVGKTTAFDTFFLFVAVMVGFTGTITEAVRFVLPPEVAMWVYISHLAFILCLFATLPYCKFAHLVYRTVAMVHERMAK